MPDTLTIEQLPPVLASALYELEERGFVIELLDRNMDGSWLAQWRRNDVPGGFDRRYYIFIDNGVAMKREVDRPKAPAFPIIPPAKAPADQQPQRRLSDVSRRKQQAHRSGEVQVKVGDRRTSLLYAERNRVRREIARAEAIWEREPSQVHLAVLTAHREVASRIERLITEAWEA